MTPEIEDKDVCGICGGQHSDDLGLVAQRVAELRAKKRPTSAERWELEVKTYDGLHHGYSRALTRWPF